MNPNQQLNNNINNLPHQFIPQQSMNNNNNPQQLGPNNYFVPQQQQTPIRLGPFPPSFGVAPPFNPMGMIPPSGLVSPHSLAFYPSSIPSLGVSSPYPIPSPSIPPTLSMNGQHQSILSPFAPQWNKDQITTSYIGKIALGVEDDFIKKILELCGKVASWKRPSDPKTGKMKGFGYCDFANAEGAMTALRVLNGLNIGGQPLLVKVDEKTQKYLDDLSLQKKAIAASEGGNIDEDEKNDANTLASIRNLIDRRENGLEYKNNGERDEEERERRIRIERERELQRKREREEREFLHSEREWETREREKTIDREREYEREMERNRRGREREARDLSYDDVERRKRTREYIRRARERKHEFDEDEAERIREIQEEEYRRRREDERREEERLQRELMRENEMQYRSPLYEPDRPLTPTNTDGFLDRTKMANGVLAVQLGASNPVIEKKKIAFLEDEPDAEDIYTKKKLKLTTLDTNLHHENDRKVKLEKVKSVIDQIPTTKEELFAYPLNWEIVEKNNIVEERMKGWVTKKIVEYLGEEENILIDFILKGIKSRSNPVDILKQISVVLDEEGEVFVTKMWQMLIYEMLSAK